MRRTTLALSVAALALCAPMAVSITGCSLAGPAIGGMWDDAHPRPDLPMDARYVTRLKPGHPCGLVLADSTVVRGLYLGLVPREPGESPDAPRRLRMGTFDESIKKVNWSMMQTRQHGISDMGRGPRDTTIVSARDVRLVVLPGDRPGTEVGAVIGIAVDAGIVIVAARHWDPNPTGCELPSDTFTATPR
jgi:hypothetical protein